MNILKKLTELLKEFAPFVGFMAAVASVILAWHAFCHWLGKMAPALASLSPTGDIKDNAMIAIGLGVTAFTLGSLK
jgi:hypothetical protein